MKVEAHVSDKKKRELDLIKKNIAQYKTLAIADLTNLPSAQLQSLKLKLRGKAFIRVSKKRLLKIAIEDLNNEELKKFLPSLENCIPALIFTDDDPFKLYNFIKKNKSNTFAKPGQIAPYDISVEPGPTPFPPGPIIGELGQAGIIATVEDGKVTIKKESKLVSEGEEINAKVADVLVKLGVEPIEIGLNIVAVYEDGTVYSRDILNVDEEEYINNIKLAQQQAFNLSCNIGYVTEDNIELLIKKGVIEAKTLAEKQNIYTSDNAKDELKKAETEVKVLEDKAPKLKDLEVGKTEEPKEETKKEVKEEPTQEQVPEETKEEIKEPQKEEIKEEPKEEEEKSEEIPAEDSQEGKKTEPKEEESKPEEPKEETQEKPKEEKKDQIGYTDETVQKAQDILTKLQDEKIKNQDPKKPKGVWD
ncbi:50S ribosomal protein L10 [archaeon]|nr:50S ribosomal protein L10 [archaeon]|tara:strand:+ start:4123 stop:5376 length:1254 start_codon:yes stop_codon:yes gene_type:complete